MQTNIMIEQVERATLLNYFEGIETALAAIQNKIVPPLKPVFLSQDEVAELLKVSRVSIWSWTKAGLLTSYRIGNQVRYIEQEVIEAVTNRATGKESRQRG